MIDQHAHPDQRRGVDGVPLAAERGRLGEQRAHQRLQDLVDVNVGRRFRRGGRGISRTLDGGLGLKAARTVTRRKRP